MNRITHRATTTQTSSQHRVMRHPTKPLIARGTINKIQELPEESTQEAIRHACTFTHRNPSPRPTAPASPIWLPTSSSQVRDVLCLRKCPCPYKKERTGMIHREQQHQQININKAESDGNPEKNDGKRHHQQRFKSCRKQTHEKQSCVHVHAPQSLPEADGTGIA